jgi:hypothetical protein
MKNYKAYFIIGLSCLLIGRFVLQPKAEVKQVIKIVEVEKKQTKKKKVTRTETKPDGSSTTNTTETEDSTTESNTSISYNSSTSNKAGLTLGVLAIKDLNKFSEKPEFGILTVAPLFGNLSITGSIDTTKRVGIGLALEF